MPLGPQHRLPKLTRKKIIMEEAQELIDQAIKNTEEDKVYVALTLDVKPYLDELRDTYIAVGWKNMICTAMSGEYAPYYSVILYA